MNRTGNLRDQDILKLLARLRGNNPKYPPNLLSKRRAAFVASIAVLGAATSSIALPAGESSGSLFAAMGVLDKIVLAVELFTLTVVTALIADTAYINRDVLKNLLFPGTPTVVQSVQNPTTTDIVPTASEIPTTATSTLLAEETPAPTDENNGANETPQPPQVPQPTKPGLHLGQTGTPGPKH